MTWLDIFQGIVIGSTSRSFQTHTSLTIFDTASEDRKQDYMVLSCVSCSVVQG